MPRISPGHKQYKARSATSSLDASPVILSNRENGTSGLFVGQKAWFATDLVPEFADFWIKNGGVRLDSIHLFEKEVRRARLRPRKLVHLHIFAKKCGSDEEPNSELLQLMVNMVIRGQNQPVAYDVDYLADCVAQKARLNLGKYILDLAPSIKAKVREIRANSASAMRAQDSSVSRVVRRLNLEDDIADAGNAEDAEDTQDLVEATATTVKITPTAILNCHYNHHKQPKEINSNTVELNVAWSNSQKTWENCQQFFESHPELLFVFLSQARDNEHMCCLLRQLKAQSTKNAASDAATKTTATAAVTNTTATATEATADSQPPQIVKPAEPLDVPSATAAGTVSQEETEKSTESEPPNTVKPVKRKRKSGKRKGRTSSKKRSKSTIKRKMDNQSLIGSRFKKDFGEGFGIHQGTVQHSLYISSRLHYHVKYDDSDSEDLAEAELLSLMQSPERSEEDTQVSRESQSKRKRKTRSSSSKDQPRRMRLRSSAALASETTADAPNASDTDDGADEVSTVEEARKPKPKKKTRKKKDKVSTVEEARNPKPKKKTSKKKGIDPTVAQLAFELSGDMGLVRRLLNGNPDAIKLAGVNRWSKAEDEILQRLQTADEQECIMLEMLMENKTLDQRRARLAFLQNPVKH